MLDPDVVQLPKEEEQRQSKSFKEVVNDAIRRGLSPQGRQPPSKPYRVKPHRTPSVFGCFDGLRWIDPL